MVMKYVDEFEFPNSGVTHVRGYARGGSTEKKAMGGIVTPPKAGIRAPRPGNAVKAQRHAESLAVKPSRGPRIGATLGVSKPPRAPAPKSNMGALQNASAPMIPPPAMKRGGPMRKAQGGKVDTAGYGPNATGDENNNGRSSHRGDVPRSRSQTDPDAGMFESGVAAGAMRKGRPGVEKYDLGEGKRISSAEMDDRAGMQAQNMRRHSDDPDGNAVFARGGRLTAASRNALPKSDFAGPDRSYPVPDKSHAANAKARATQMAARGQLSPSAKARIDAKANRVLGK